MLACLQNFTGFVKQRDVVILTSRYILYPFRRRHSHLVYSALFFIIISRT